MGARDEVESEQVREPRGRFIVLDGIDGSGKSTQAALLARTLELEGLRVLHVRDPGTTKVGEALRQLVLTRDHELGADVETLVFVAARAQLLRELVAPALARGVHVVCERFHPSTFAYQATAGGLDEQRVLALCQAWAGEPRPDLVLLLDLDVEHVSARRAATRDRIEDKGLEFQRQVAHGYRRYAELDRTVRVLDAGGTRAQVAAAILEEVRRALR